MEIVLYFILSTFFSFLVTCVIIPSILYKPFGYCHRHGWFMYPKRFRQNTNFVNDEMNYMVGCKYCKEESDEYWAEMWKDYYSSIWSH